MTHLQMAIRTIIAAPVAGALCALGVLVVWFAAGVVAGGGGDDIRAAIFIPVVWLIFAAPIGVVAGSVLGAVPVVVSIVVWPALEQRRGTDGAIDRVVLLVAAIAFLETMCVAWVYEAGPIWACAWALGGAVVCALTLRWMLRRGRRLAERRARAVTTY